MKSSTLLAVGALVLSGSATAHLSAANPQPAHLRGAVISQRIRPHRAARVVDRVITAERVEAKGAVVTERESEHHYRVTLPAGCSRVVAIGDGTVRDLALEVHGPATMRMRQDAAHGVTEMISVCGQRAAQYEVVVSAKGSAATPGIELRVRTQA
jgi:hypothetical protein